MRLWMIGILAVALVILLERWSRERARRVKEPGVIRFDPDLIAELRDLLGRGRKIEAIQLYRARSGAGSRTAKRADEALERQLSQ
jgi:hypothetical protein